MPLVDLPRRVLAEMQLASIRRRGSALGTEDRCSGRAGDPVISLTSFPERLPVAHYAIHSLLRQKSKPKEILLNLARDEFDTQTPVIPQNIRQLEDRGLTIQWLDNTKRVYNKLLPALQLRPDDKVVTADDDVIYPPDWLGGLVEANHQQPMSILGHRGTRILISSDGPRPYTEWPPASTGTPSTLTFLTGVGGILYPPNTLPAVTLDIDLALSLCPTNDDLWYKAMELLAGAEVRRISDSSQDFRTIRRAQTRSLRDINVGARRNDEQFRAVIEHFRLWRHFDECDDSHYS